MSVLHTQTSFSIKMENSRSAQRLRCSYGQVASFEIG